MSSGRKMATIGLLLALAGSPSLAQQSGQPSDSAGSASGTGTPSTDQPKGRNRLLIDVIKTVVPPLIDAATSKPKPAPAEQPVAAEPAPAETPAPAPAAATPAVAEPAPAPAALPESAVMPASMPQPSPREASPPPSAQPAKPPPAADSPSPPWAPSVQPVAPPAVDTGIEGTSASAPAPPASPPPAAQPPTPDEPGWPLALLVAIAVAIAAAAAIGLSRASRIARTRKLLGLVPRLEAPAERGGSKGLSLAAPAIAVRARLKAEPARA